MDYRLSLNLSNLSEEVIEHAATRANLHNPLLLDQRVRYGVYNQLVSDLLGSDGIVASGGTSDSWLVRIQMGVLPV